MPAEQAGHGVINIEIQPPKMPEIAAETAQPGAAQVFAPITNHSTTTSAPPPTFVQHDTTPAVAPDAEAAKE